MTWYVARKLVCDNIVCFIVEFFAGEDTNFLPVGWKKAYGKHFCCTACKESYAIAEFNKGVSDGSIL